MVFSSALFLVIFLPVFLIVYYLLPRQAKNHWVLLASIVFYAWGAPDFIFIVLGSVIIDFYIVKFIPGSQRTQKRLLAGLSIILNIGLLAYFKYANFFVENFNNMLGQFGVEPARWTAVALPIGISFFTFQKITYTVDVYRNMHQPLQRVTDYAMYILMFPQLIAGPIVRYNEVADQLVDRRANETAENRFAGFFRFVIGLSKKVLIANVLGAEADKIFSMDPAHMATGTAWLGVIAYAFQIYFDFSGYSDMAIGLGQMIGIRFPENFNNPYISQSISEFWRRWHMTLGRFMRDYLYIPLGGNKVKPARLYINLWLVFLISGLWHGAAWNFVVWGAFHGLFLILDRLFLLKILGKIGKIPAMTFTFFITLIGWVLFRADTLSQAGNYLKAMFIFQGKGQQVFVDQKFIVILVLAFIFSFMGAVRGNEKWQERLLSPHPVPPPIWGREKGRGLMARMLFAITFFLLSLASVLSSGFNPFIYFRF